MRVVELFAGVGGFRLGFESAGHEIVFANEWDKHAAKTYNHNFGGSIDERDIKTIKTTEIPEHDLLCGGFPCQTFSVAGRRAGFDDTRGTMFFEIARVLADKRPGHFLLENVKGLLTHDSGKTFQTILGVLADLGYRVEWQLLNSKGFGVPQSRERIYIVGHYRSRCAGAVLPITGTNGKDINEITSEAPQSQRIYGTDGVAPTASGGGIPGGSHEIKVFALTETRTEEAKAIRRQSRKEGTDFSPRRGKVLTTRTDDMANTVTSSLSKEHLVLVREATKKGYAEAGVGDSIDISNPKSNTRRGRVGKDQAHTVDTSTGGDRVQATVMADGRVRRLTPTEYERLQGFPDQWTIGSDTQRYRQMGNAVTVNVVAAIAQSLSRECAA